MESEKLTVYLCGSHCAGKTTLQNSLLRHPEFSKFGFIKQDEVARKLIKQKGYTKKLLLDRNIFYQMEKEILEAQYIAEKQEISEFHGEFSRFLWDRGVLDPLGYVAEYIGKTEADEYANLPHVKQMLSRLKCGEDCLVFLVKPRKEFIEKDDVRRDSSIEELLRLHYKMRDILVQMNINHTEITCSDLDQRVQLVVDAVKRKWTWLAVEYDTLKKQNNVNGHV